MAPSGSGNPDSRTNSRRHPLAVDFDVAGHRSRPFWPWREGGGRKPEAPRSRRRHDHATVYQHVHPGMGREAADRFAALLKG